MNLEYVVKVEKLVLKIYDPKQKVHKAAVKCEGLAVEMEVEEHRVRVRSMVHMMKAFFVMSSPLPLHSRGNANYFNTPSSKSHILDTPSTT